MQEKYAKVPEDLISGKDLNYLCDMFQWNYDCLKSTNEALSRVSDMEIKNILEQAYNLFNQNMQIILDILSNRGGDINE